MSLRAAPVFWMTGLSGAGKSTLAEIVERRLESSGRTALVLDGDVMRTIIGKGLGFSRSDVAENNRRVAEHCSGRRSEADVMIVSTISPYAEGRRVARSLLDPGFFLIYVAADLATVMKRDVKGLYQRAVAGEITDMLGYSEDYPYEPPADADIVIASGKESPEDCAENLYRFMIRHLA